MSERRTRDALGQGSDGARLGELLALFPRQTILVLGDFVVDEYVTGEISRVSREAPVLILRHRQTEIVPGGGANAVNNLSDLGVRALPVGILGDDAAGEALLRYFGGKGIDTSGILRVPGWTTTTKTRYLARWTHTARQQVLRVDREPGSPLASRVAHEVARKARARLGRAHGVLISDYGAGVITPRILRGLPLGRAILDSRHRLLDYRGVRLMAATPNEPEIEALYHTSIGTDRDKLRQLGKRTLRALELKALLVTRGKDGMVLFERGKPPCEIPVYGRDDAVDVTGAGDTVIAVFTAALAAGATFVEAAHLANCAGGIVVMKRGTATITRKELETAVRGGAGSGT